MDAKVTNNFLLLPPPPCSSGFVFDNRWVIPYNPYLTMRYQCHINVEVCSSITAMKYLYKYVYKGHDHALAMVQLEAGALPAATPQAATGGADGNNVPTARDEVQNYLDGRYVSAMKLAIDFLPLTYTTCTPMFTTWLFIYLMSKPLTFRRGPWLGKP